MNIDDPSAGDAKQPSMSVSLMALVVSGLLALFCCCSGTAVTLLASMASEDSGTVAAMVSAPAIGFGFGGLLGATVSHFGIAPNDDRLALRIGIPLAGALWGAIALGVVTAVFVAVIFPAL